MNHIRAVFMKQLTSLIKVPIMIGMSMFFFVLSLLMIIFNDGDSDCLSCIPAYICSECYASAAFRLPESPIGMVMASVAGLALVMYTAMLVNEDRNTGNFKFMSMATVNPWQYMAGAFASAFLVAMAIFIPFAVLGVVSEDINLLLFMLVAMAGGAVAVFLGVTLGMAGSPLASIITPFVMGMLPMFSQANETISNLSQFVFTQQILVAIADLDANLTRSFIIIAANGLVFFVIFILLHRKNKLRVDNFAM